MAKYRIQRFSPGRSNEQEKEVWIFWLQAIYDDKEDIIAEVKQLNSDEHYKLMGTSFRYCKVGKVKKLAGTKDEWSHILKIYDDKDGKK